MALSPGTRLGPYEIMAVAGSGGMGEVYRARDTRLDRIVAIKVLPEALLQDPGRRQRLEREARAVSSLSHPHICTLHDVGHQDGVDYLVMEYLEGETLAKRLQKGPLTPDQVLRYAMEIASALDTAHRQGIVHRDLKPGNIMLTRAGAKLLDFGLARAHAEAPAGISGLTATPTRSDPLTAEGTMVGTMQYMAPEQLEGKPADARSDLFSFGTVLYEVATGRKAFQGKSQASLIAAILTSEPPPLLTLQPLTPPELEWVVRGCLAKDPQERWQSAHDVMLMLKGIADAGPQAGIAAPGAARVKAHERAWMATAILLGLAIVPFAISYVRRPATEPRAIRSAILPPEKSTFLFSGISSGPVVISPDGARLAFVARTPEGRNLLWVRSLDMVTARPLEGTDGATFPFWSADGRFIGFFADAKLKKIDASGGSTQTLCDASIGRGGSWNSEGTIIFAPDVNNSIYRVSATGGEPTPVTALDESRHQYNHRWPYFLADGRHFLFFARSPDGEYNGTYVGSLDSKEQKLLLPGASNALYAPPGYLLFVRERALMAWRFDARSLEFTGEAVPVAESVGVNGSAQRAGFSVSSNGILAYQGGGVESGWQLVWFDRAGKQFGTVGETAIHLFHRLSPDGQKVVEQINDARTGNVDLWIYDLARGVKTRLTFEPANESWPVWSPDGTHIAYASNRKLHFQIYQRASSGVGAEEPLFEEPDTEARPLSWSRDGRYLAFMRRQVRGTTRADIWILPLFGDRKAFPILQSPFEESMAAFSPDGRWLAYESNESGKIEVYVTPFPGAGGKWQVSAAGGSAPRWRGDGLELYYLAADNKLMAVGISPKGPTLEIGAVRSLFQARPVVGPGGGYDAAWDGKRFLIDTETEQAAGEPITLVVNWTADLRR
jgi:eukaryotic-like serine/threonine-protein kinase